MTKKGRIGAGATGLIVAATIAGASLAGAAGTRDAGPPLEPAATWTPSGLSPELRSGEPGDRVRVRIVLADQPLLVATEARGFRRAVRRRVPERVASRAAASPTRITAAEKRIARRAEERYEGAVAGLEDGADAAAASERRLARELGIARSGPREGEIVSSLVARLPRSALSRIARRDDVQLVEPAPRERPLMDVSVPVTGAPSWWGAGFTGGTGGSDPVPADAGVKNEAPDSTHPAFVGVTVDNDADVNPDVHGTHVAGVIASQDATYRGVAHGADRLVSGDERYLLGVSNEGQPGASDPVETINRSFGGTHSNDDFNLSDDVLTSQFGVGYAQGAGNSNVDGSPTVENTGRNMLSVGALFDQNTTLTADDVMATFSSRGPSVGGRKKPDLIAPGVQVKSPTDHWENTSPPCDGAFTDPDTSCEDYTNESGTSFASPMVAGAMTLLEGAGITNPKVQRALLINSARDFDGQTSWEPDSGWGALDLTEALARRTQTVSGSVPGGGARFYRATVDAGDKATLAWELRGFNTDYAGPLGSNQRVTYTVSNLDLRAYRASDLTALAMPADPGHGGGPDAGDPNDTIEQLRSPAAHQTIYKVEAVSAIDGAASEPFALAAEATLEELTAPEVDPVNTTGSGSSVPCGSEVTITTALENASDDLDAVAAQVSLSLPAGVELVSGPATQDVSGGTLEASTPASEVHSWTVRPTTHGTHELTLTGSGGTMGETFTSSAPVTIAGSCPPADPPPPGAAEVVPTSIATDAPGPFRCGETFALRAGFANRTVTDAQEARADLVLPAAAGLVSGTFSQTVSGGVLEAGGSDERVWSLRLLEPGSHAVTITGSGAASGATYRSAASIVVSCERRRVSIELREPRVRAGRIVVSGELATGDGGTPSRSLRIRAIGRRRDPADSAEPDDRFRSRLRVCEPGRRTVSVRYPGDVGYRPSVERETIRVKASELRC